MYSHQMDVSCNMNKYCPSLLVIDRGFYGDETNKWETREIINCTMKVSVPISRMPLSNLEAISVGIVEVLTPQYSM